MGRGLSRPRDGFLLGGRNDGGTTSCPRTLVPRGGRWGEASRVPGMDSCSEAGMTVEPRRARARWYPEGDMGRGLSRVPGMDSCSEAGLTVEPRRARARGYPEGEYGAGPLPHPRDGFLLGGRIDGGTTSCPRTRVPRGGRWGGPLPHPRDGFLLKGRNDGGRLLPLTTPIPLAPVSSTGQALSLSKGVSGRSVALQPTLALPTPVENAAPCGRSRLSHVERYRMGE